MTMFKAHWDTEGDNVRLSMPFSKIDFERRIVSGFATLDNVDKQNDIVTTDASLQAFSRFRGNIREMHQPRAVGKMIDFKEDKYFDPESKKFYSGVYVSAYVSKGAPDTWEKVIDGTYTGFSIGGKMNKWDDGYDEKSEMQIRIIKDYDLVELSLVDNPANQFANILSIEKVDGVEVLKGEMAETVLENVFWDQNAGLIMLSEEDSVNSPTTGEPMINIGFVEKSDEDKTDMIKFLVDSAKGINTSKITKEVSPMTDETSDFVEKADEAISEEVVEKSDEVAPEAGAETVEKSDDIETADSEVEKADEVSAEAEVEEAEAAESEIEKSDEAEVEVEVSKSDEVTAGAVSEIKDVLTSAFSDLAETVKALHAEVDALKKSITGVSDEISAAKHEISETRSQFDEFGKRVDAVEADTAFRKSGDLGEIVQEQPEILVEKSLWGGRFLKTADLFK